MSDWLVPVVILAVIAGGLTIVGMTIAGSLRRIVPPDETASAAVELPPLTAEQWATRVVMLILMVAMAGGLIYGAVQLSRDRETVVILGTFGLLAGVIALRIALLSWRLRRRDRNRRR